MQYFEVFCTNKRNRYFTITTAILIVINSLHFYFFLCIESTDHLMNYLMKFIPITRSQKIAKHTISNRHGYESDSSNQEQQNSKPAKHYTTAESQCLAQRKQVKLAHSRLLNVELIFPLSLRSK